MKKEEIKQKLKDGFNLNTGSPNEKSNFFSVFITFIFALLSLNSYQDGSIILIG